MLESSTARRRVRRVGTTLLIGAAVVGSAWLAGRPVAASTPDAAAFAIDREALDRYARIGVAHFDCTAREVRVLRSWWSAIDWEGKSSLVTRVEQVCDAGQDDRRVTVRDAVTGRELQVDRPGWLALDR